MRIDPRAGSQPLIDLMRRRGVRDVTSALLPSGDIEIEGRGPEGRPVSVGVEYKHLPDLLQCIDNGRFIGTQLPAMLDRYEVIWLLVEGIWREGRDGRIEVPRGASWKPVVAGSASGMASALSGWLMTMQQKVGIKVMLTGTTSQTADWLYHLNRWWTSKEWEEHRAHLAFDNSQAIALIRKPSLLRCVAKELPGIGMGKSGHVAKHFGSVFDMALADEAEWEKIEGVGKTMAGRIVKAVRGEAG